jgi:hypothetical protein
VETRNLEEESGRVGEWAVQGGPTSHPREGLTAHGDDVAMLPQRPGSRGGDHCPPQPKAMHIDWLNLASLGSVAVVCMGPRSWRTERWGRVEDGRCLRFRSTRTTKTRLNSNSKTRLQSLTLALTLSNFSNTAPVGVHQPKLNQLVYT